MTRKELKKLIRECFLEVLAEEFIQKSVKEVVQERIVINIPTPQIKIGKDSEEEAPLVVSPAISKPLNEYKSKLPNDVRKKLLDKVVADDGDVLVASKINGFQNPQLRALAQDTLEHQAEKAEQQKEETKFSQAEIDLIQPQKALKILDAVDKR